MSIKIYAEELAAFPADVVRHVLKTQHKTSPWWPAWAELQERLDLHSRRRQLMGKAIRARQ